MLTIVLLYQIIEIIFLVVLAKLFIVYLITVTFPPSEIMMSLFIFKYPPPLNIYWSPLTHVILLISDIIRQSLKENRIEHKPCKCLETLIYLQRHNHD